jgi:hypothetical protein
VVERVGRRPLLVRLRLAEAVEVEPPRRLRGGGRAAAVASLHGGEQEELLPLAAGAAIPQPYEPAGPAKNRIGLRRATQERRRETSK